MVVNSTYIPILGSIGMYVLKFMGKYTNQKKLSSRQQEDLLIRFVKAIASVKNSVEAAHFIKDLLSDAEVLMIARRLQIVDLLEDGYTYEQIKKSLKVSFGTIAKMQTWFETYGEDFKKILYRTRTTVKVEDRHSPWVQLKRKYPMYFWPELLLKEIVKSANSREKEKLRNVLKQSSTKTKLTDLNKLLNMT